MKRWSNISMYLSHSFHEQTGIIFQETEWEAGSMSMLAKVGSGTLQIRNNECTATVHLSIGIHDILFFDIADAFPNPVDDDLDIILSLIFLVCSNSSSAIYPKNESHRIR